MNIYLMYLAITLFFMLKIFRTPSSALALAGFMFAFEQWAQASSLFFLNHRIFTNVIVGIIVLLAVFICWTRGGIQKGVFPKAGRLIVYLFVYSIISIAWAPSYELSLMQWRQAIPYIITITLLSPLTISSPNDLHPMFSAMIWLGTILTVLLLFTVEWNGRFIVLGDDIFKDKITGNPLSIGQLGGTLAFLGFFYRFKNEFKIWRLLRWGVVFLGLMLVIQTGARGQLIAAIGLMFCFWFLENPSRNIFKPLIGLLMLGVILMVVNYLIDMYWMTEVVGDSRRFTNEVIVGDIEGRLTNVFVLLEHWLASPFSILFGLGNSASYDPKILGLYPHMVPLEILGEEGVIGFLLYFILILKILGGSFTSYKKVKKEQEQRNMLVCLMSLWSYAFILTLKQGSMLLAQDFFMYSMVLVKFNEEIKKQ